MRIRGLVFSFALWFAQNAAFAQVVPKDVVSCASPKHAYTLEQMFEYAQEGHLILPLFNREGEMVGFIPAWQEKGDRAVWRFNGIRLCAEFMGDFYYNDDDAELASSWVSTSPKKMEIHQDEGILLLEVQDYVSPDHKARPETQLVRVTFEATDLTVGEGDDGTVVGKGEFFVFIPKAWLNLSRPEAS